MKTTIDRDGRITLGQEVQAQLGVQPGDDVLLENRGDEWVIKAAKSEMGLRHDGSVLMHRGTALPVAADEAELLEDTGPVRMGPRDSRTVAAQIVSAPRRPISTMAED